MVFVPHDVAQFVARIEQRWRRRVVRGTPAVGSPVLLPLDTVPLQVIWNCDADRSEILVVCVAQNLKRFVVQEKPVASSPVGLADAKRFSDRVNDFAANGELGGSL